MICAALLPFGCQEPTDDSDGDKIVGPVEESYNEKIVFISDRDGSGQVYLMNRDGSSQARITNDSSNYHHPRFSPDGTEILFYSETDGNSEIYVIDTSGSNLRNLSDSPGKDMVPQYSPDGTQIVFVSEREENREIYIMNSDGTEQTRLTNNSWQDYTPSFSPDGKTIVFYSTIEEISSSTRILYSYDIFTINTDGTNLQRLTAEGSYIYLASYIPDYSQNTFDAAPKFSPNGRKITFATYFVGHGYDIFIMDADGSNQVRITDVEGYNSDPRFTPDGSKIFFRTHRISGFHIYEMNLNGSNQVDLTAEADHAYMGDFTAESKYIIFTDMYGFGGDYKIFRMNRDGTNTIRLTSGNYQDRYPQVHTY
ncbi:MAG: PD40 domain-containing protein [Fidelibacterota bacterium]|nr:MAG: PD40 domain-containing protein [Candidatus Neomarinimicrobiota bacterium]